jgi:hypothetical protein
MKQIKLFEDSDRGMLQEEVNSWLKEYQYIYTIIDIQYQCANSSAYSYSVMIYYHS